MATLADRVNLVNDTQVRARIRMELIGECIRILRTTPAPVGTNAQKKEELKELIEAQKFAAKVLADLARWDARVADAVVADAPDAQVDDGLLDDTEIRQRVRQVLRAFGQSALREAEEQLAALP